MSVRFGDPVAIRAYQHSPSIEPSSPGLTNADTIEDGYDSRREPDENDMLKYRMLLTFAETDIHQLKEALAKECERANAEKLRADKAEKVSSQVTDKLHEAFEKSKADEASRNEARKDAKQAKLEANHLREKLDDAQTALRKLEDDLKEASKPQVHTDQAMINHLHSTISTRDSNIERLREKNDELMAENFTALAQIKQDSGEIQSLSEKNSVQAAKITNLSSKLAIVEGDYDKHKKAVARHAVEENNVRTSNEIASATQLTAFSDENTKLKSDITLLTDQLTTMNWRMACTIMQLDLASANLRVFTCTHKSFEDIPDGPSSTREKRDWLIADEAFTACKGDEGFLKEYFDARDEQVNHHRAHEKIRQGRGSLVRDIRKELRDADRRREVVSN